MFLFYVDQSGTGAKDNQTNFFVLTAVAIIKTYRNWVQSKEYDTGFVEQPWFGVSQFCLGLQLADYVAYLIDIKSQQLQGDNRKAEFMAGFNMLEEKIYLFTIPSTEKMTL
jgi:Protein of unknown function (DUF3800)